VIALLTRPAGVAVPALLLLIALLWVLDPGTAYESPALLVLLTLFGTLASFTVAWLLGRGFLARGRPGLLLFGCGMLAYGSAGTIGTLVGLWLAHPDGFNSDAAVTIHNLGVWVAALCHLVGVLVGRHLGPVPHARAWWLAGGYGLALTGVAAITAAAAAGWFPPFLLPGQGGTAVRTFVLASAIAIYVLTALLLGTDPRRRSDFADWYTLALLLLATGLCAVLLQPVPGSLLGWTGRLTQFLAGLYLLLAALAAVRASAADSAALALADPQAAATRYPYLVACVLVVSVTALRLAFMQDLGTHVSFLVFYPAVMLAALYGGLRPGLLAAGLSVLLAVWFWTAPVGSFAITAWVDALSIAFFFLSSLLIAWTAEALHRTQARAVAAETRAEFAAERARGTRALQESLARQALGIEVAGIALADIDYRSGTIYLSGEAARLFGLGLGATRVTRALVHARFHPLDRAELERRIAAALDPAGPGTVAMDHRIVRPDGQVRWLSIRKRIVFERTGTAAHPLRGMLAAQDITERKLAEDALRASEERLQLVLQASAMGTFEIDLDTGVTCWNAVEYELLGLKPGAVAADPQTFFSQVLPEDRERAETGWARALQTGQLDLEVRVRRADGEVRWLAGKGRFAAAVVGDAGADGTRRRFLGVNFDITESKRTEEALAHQAERLRETAAQLRETDRRKDEFLAMLGHELRNPLAPIVMAAEALRLRGGEDPALVQWASATIRHQGQHLTRLVNDLLDAARVTQGKITLERAPVALGNLLARALEAFAHLLEEREHTLVFKPQTTELAGEPLTVEGDAVRLEQVIGNLLSNAAKYTPKGGRIEVSLTREGEEAVIRVRDNGIGIPAAMLPQVFDLFTQAERAMDLTQGGLGIGLALVKRLVEMHGGSVTATSPGADQGTEVRVQLPLLAALPAPAPARDRAGTASP